MRSLSIVFCVLAITSSAWAKPPSSEPASEEPQVEARPRLKQLGLALQAGVPDAATASVVYRPWQWLRLHAGPGYNMVGFSAQGGVALIPFGWGPSLTLEGGHFFDANANKFARKMAGPSYTDIAVLNRFGYDYANAHLGLELGKETFTFFIHGGMSYFGMAVKDVDTALQSATQKSMSTTEVHVGAPIKVHAFVPSMKLGFMVYVW